MKEIKLTQGKFTQVDDEDYDYLKQFKWIATNPGGNIYYAVRKQKMENGKRGRNIRMHREILGITDPRINGDHKDHNGLNNQRYNLRVATPAQNRANSRPVKNSSSKYLGVYWNKAARKWRAKIKKDYKGIYLGSFTNEIDAAKAYNDAAIKFHGEFANLNIIF